MTNIVTVADQKDGLIKLSPTILASGCDSKGKDAAGRTARKASLSPPTRECYAI